MKHFAELITRLDETTKTNRKVEALEKYFQIAPDEDKLWALALFTGRRPRRIINSTLLRTWAAELSGIPTWLFEESYHTVGDLAETISLLIPGGTNYTDKSLSEWITFIRQLPLLEESERRKAIQDAWKQMDEKQAFVFNKLITGNFRIGVSQQLVVKALASYLQMDQNRVAHCLMGNWDPVTTTFNDLLLDSAAQTDHSKPYPFYLAYAAEEDISILGEPADWQAEWKWDGIRGQLIKRNGELFLWSRGEELVTQQYPEFTSLKDILPDGTVIDGEILPFKDGVPLSFNALQTRISRKNLSQKLMAEVPVVLIAYDILEYNHEDLRAKSLHERRALLEDLVRRINSPVVVLSAILDFTSWDHLTELRKKSREHFSEGVMLKRKSSVYETGRRRGNWWKWKIEPLTVDAVLVYAQPGHGRRANLYTDYTFAVWDKDVLVPFAKAYSGLTDKEIAEVDKFVRSHTLEKFGPVRSITPELVFEVAFEGIQASARHKSGVALRFPRILRWRKDKKAEEADTIAYLKEMLEKYGKIR